MNRRMIVGNGRGWTKSGVAVVAVAMWCGASGAMAAGPSCGSDLDHDGTVNSFDLAALLGNWGPCDGCNSDSNEDGQVNSSDLALLLISWGEDLCSGNDAVSMTAGLYECVDLDGVAVTDPGMGICDAPEVDVHLAYNSESDHPVRVISDYAAGMALLSATPYASVDCQMLEGLDLSAAAVEAPLDANDTIVIMTSDGDYYKLGAPQVDFPEGEMEVTFSFGRLCPPASIGE